MKRISSLCLMLIAVFILSLAPVFTHTVYASEDIGWSWANPYPIGSELTSITYANGMFIATGSNGVIITSIDGETWDIQDSSTSSYLADIAYLGDKFWCVGDGVVLNSTDGINWTNPNTGAAITGRSIGYNGSRYVVTSSSSIRYSDDEGATWNLVNLGTTFGWSFRWLQDIVWDGSQFVVVGQSGTVVTSPDGINWTEQASTVTAHLRAITHNGTTFVALGDNGTIITSLNGITWVAQTSGTASGLKDITWDGSQFVAVGNPYGEYFCILTSPDGLNWTNHNNPSFRVSLSGVAWNGIMFVAVGSNGAVIESSDGAVWEKISQGTTQTLYDVTWNGSQYVAVGAYGAVVTSPDGLNWTEHNLTMSVVSPLTLIPDLKAVTWGNGQFVAVGGYGIIVTSPNGMDWTKRYANLTIGNFNDVIWAGSPLNLFIVGGSKGKLLTSPDGITWTEHPLGLPSTYQMIECLAWNGSKVAAAGGGSSIADRFVATSTDTVIWNINSVTSGFSDIIWDGTRFLAIESGITIYTSPDGDTWTKTSGSPSSSLLHSLVWDTSQYTAVGRVALHSSDGNTWKVQTMPTGNELWGITWNGYSQHVAVGQYGTILVAGEPYVAPAFVSAATSIDGDIITITFSKPMADPTGKHGQFSYKIDGGDAQVFSGATLDDDYTKINLTVSGTGTAIAFGDTVTISYTAGDVKAADGGMLQTFIDQPVINNVLPPAPDTPEVLIDNLIDDVAEMDIPENVKSSLTPKLDTAKKILADNNTQNDVAAINNLKALINSIEAQRGKKISIEDADALIAKAQEIITALSGGT